MGAEKNLTDGIALLVSGMKLLEAGPASYWLRKLTAARTLLLTRFVPFPPGTRVTLVREQRFYDASGAPNGWHGFRHFLVPGAKGTVIEADCDPEGVLHFGVTFDNESRMGDKGETHPVTSRHQFRLREDDLTRAGE